MLISAAYAQGTGSAGGGDFFVQIMPLLLIFVVFYFLLIRPQQKKMKAHRDMVGGLQRGDKVITGGGLFATVSKVEEDAEAPPSRTRLKLSRERSATILVQKGRRGSLPGGV